MTTNVKPGDLYVTKGEGEALLRRTYGVYCGAGLHPFRLAAGLSKANRGEV